MEIVIPFDKEFVRGWMMELASDTAKALQQTGVVVSETAVYESLLSELTLEDILPMMTN